MNKKQQNSKSRTYVVRTLLDQNEADPAEGLLGHSEAYQRILALNTQIADLQEEMQEHIVTINTVLQNEWLVGAAQAFAKKKHLRAANSFSLDRDGTLMLVCDGIERTVTKKYKHKVETMAELRQRGKDLGIAVDALGLGAQRRKIAAHLDEATAQRKREAKAAKMVRTGDAVPVTLA